MRTIPSLLRPRTHAYVLHDSIDPLWESRGSDAICSRLGAYETYGDGTVQHSVAWVPRRQDLTDVFLSLADALLRDIHAPDWRHLHVVWPVPRQTILFVHGLRYKEARRQYYNRSACKVSTAPDKQFDTRWRTVPPWANGTAAATYRLLNCPSFEWLDRFALAESITEALAGTPDRTSSCELLAEELQSVPGKWALAWSALHSARLAATYLPLSRQLVDSVLERPTPTT